MGLGLFKTAGPPRASNPGPWTGAVGWPGLVQLTITAASFGWFTMLFLIFCKVFPSVSMYEVKELVFHHRRLSARNQIEDLNKEKDDAIRAQEGVA